MSPGELEGNGEHKGAESEDVEGEGEKEGSPLPCLAVEIEHLVEDEGGAQK